MNTDEIVSLTENSRFEKAQFINSVEDLNKYIKAGSYGVSVCQLNVRSLNKNFDDFLILLNTLQFKCDVLILCETWEVVNLNLYNIPGYIAYFNNSNLLKMMARWRTSRKQ